MSKRNLAVIMDPIEAISPKKDSTLAMLVEAQSRGWGIHYGGLQNIWLRDDRALGRLTRLKVADNQTDWFELGEESTVPLGDMDVILMRKDPPFDIDYIVATYILQQAEGQGALVVNNPQGLRDANEKVSLAWFPGCTPPTLVSRLPEEFLKFMGEHPRIVVKPLNLMGGQSVFVTGADDGNRNVILESVTRRGTRYAMAQEYQPEIISTGDKRILLIDGQPIPLALARIPSPGDHRGNMVAGATVEVRPLTERDTWICEQVGPVLRERGLLFTGIDVIGNFMTELNVTSPTGIRELEHASDVQITKQLFDVIASKLA